MNQYWPIFENATSPIYRSNDGRLSIVPLEDGVFTVTDDNEQTVAIYTKRREIADAYVAGYDEHERITRERDASTETRSEEQLRREFDELGEADFHTEAISDPAVSTARPGSEPSGSVRSAAGPGLASADSSTTRPRVAISASRTTSSREER